MKRSPERPSRIPRAAVLLAAVALPFLGIGSAGAFQADDRLDALLDDAVRWMEPGGDGFSGAGAQQLLAEAGSAEFLIVGERHGTRETPELMEWLLRSLRPLGYEAYGVEIGPISAATLEGMAGADDARARLEEFFVSTPFSVPFFWWEEELDSLVSAVEAGYDIWGLDQEFVGSGRVHLRRLRELAPDDDARRLIESWWEREMQGLAHFQQTQSTERAIFMTITEEEIDQLRAAFDGVEEAQEVIDELAASALPYQLFAAGENYRSNYERIRLIKRHFNDYLKEPGGPEPTGGGKVLLKFGSVHAGRGYSSLHQLDVGNQVAELAALRGGDSLNVLVTSRHFQPAEGEAADMVAAVPHLAPILERVDGDRWGVFDLRRLRPLLHTASGSEGREALADTVWAYDLIVVAPTFHPAHDVGS